MFVFSECDCPKCSSMCHSPCTGTPDDIKAIIDAGYGDRLCLDDWPGEVADIHPALKGYESGKAPFNTSSSLGCSFWKEGKCELHDKGLKPLGGKYAHHDMLSENWIKIKPFLEKEWGSKKGKDIIKKWTKEYLK